MNGPFYLIWWIISDIHPEWMQLCQKMSALVCNTSLLKATDYRLKGKTFGYKMCTRCDLGITEDARNLVMICTFYELRRGEMINEIKDLGPFNMDGVGQF